MIPSSNRVTVCICTYKRPHLLARLLTALEEQEPSNLFSYSIVVVDNDHMGSAETTVQDFRSRSRMAASYHIEPEQNIALARNTAIAHATGDAIAFIDDDEIPGPRWLLELYNARDEFRADGVLGPVIPVYEVSPPRWVVRGKFHERPTHKTGELLHWTKTRTGNVLLGRDLFAVPENMFRREFGSGGEDRDFFKRMIATGRRFVWCAEAPVYESVTADRCTRSSMLKRALLRGQLPHFTLADFVRSLLAVPLYTAALPILLIVGHHLFMKYLVKDCDHIGRLLSFLGVSLIKERYV